MGYLHDNVSLVCMFCFLIGGHYRAFSHDVTAAILVFQNNETTAVLHWCTKKILWELNSFLM